MLIGSWRALLDGFRGTPYYIDVSGGNDTNKGQSQSEAWQTVAKINGETFSPGDRILFKRGELWRERLNVPSSGVGGSPITFGAYGVGADPIITGDVVITGFVVHAGNVYKKDPFTGTADKTRQVREDGVRLIYKTALGDVVQGSYYLDDGNDILYVWSTDDADPDTHIIEVPDQWATIDFNGKSYLVFNNIHAQGSARSGFDFRQVANASYIRLNDCEASWCSNRGIDIGGGGGILGTQSGIVFTNCISHDNLGEAFWISGTRNGVINCIAYNNGKDRPLKGYTWFGGGGIVIGISSIDCYVRRCTVYDTYYNVPVFIEFEGGGARPLRTIIEECSIRNELGTGFSTLAVRSEGQESIWRNNLIIFDGDVDAIRVTDGSTDEKFYFNSVYRKRNPDGDTLFYADDASGLTLRNNSFQFVGAGAADVIIEITAGAQAGFDSDYNMFDYQGANGSPYKWGAGAHATLVLWAAASGTDGNSDEDDPDYVDPANDDLHLQASSPNRGAGIAIAGIADDYDEVARADPPDIGAYEYVA